MLSDARDEEEQIAAANVLWVLAFDQENSKSMQDDEHCMAELRKLKENQSRDVQRVASGALWEIEGKRSKLADSDGTSILPKVASRALPSMHEEKAKKKKKMLMKNSRSVPADDQGNIHINYIVIFCPIGGQGLLLPVICYSGICAVR